MDKTIIIGGGLNGLATAYFLGGKKAILEAKVPLESRIRTIYSKQPLDLGAQFFSGGDKNVTEIIKRLMMDRRLREINLSKLSILHNRHIVKLKTNGSFIDNTAETEELAEFYEFLVDEQFLENYQQELSKTDFASWYRSNVGRETLWFPEAMTKAITFAKPKEICALFGIIVCATFFGKNYSFKNGMQELTQNLMKKAKASIRNERLTEVELQNGRAVSFTTNKKKRNVLKDSLISAIPSNAIAKVIKGDGELSKCLEKIPFAGCSVLVLETEKKMLGNEHGVMLPGESKISIMIEETMKFGKKTKNGILTIMVPYAQDSKPASEKEILREIEPLGVHPDKIQKSYFKSWDYGLPICNPELFRVQEQIKEIEKQYTNFAICGDFMGLPSLDACVESAKIAAEKIRKNSRK